MAAAVGLPSATPLPTEDLRALYKGKEQDPKAFLDMAGVRDRSKVAVVDDPEARARRLLEELCLGSLHKAAGAVAAEVDKIAPKVAALEASVRKGEKVAEKDVTTVTELLMNELLKLDAVVAGGDVKAQRRAQVKRVQKYVETLDAVTAKNATIARKPAAAKKQPPPPAARQQQQPQSQRQRHQQPPQQPQPQPPAQTTRWEMFDGSAARWLLRCSAAAGDGSGDTARWLLRCSAGDDGGCYEAVGGVCHGSPPWTLLSNLPPPWMQWRSSGCYCQRRRNCVVEQLCRDSRIRLGKGRSGGQPDSLTWARGARSRRLTGEKVQPTDFKRFSISNR